MQRMDIAQQRHTFYRANLSYFLHRPVWSVGWVCFSDAFGDVRTPVAFNKSLPQSKTLSVRASRFKKSTDSYLQQVHHSRGGRGVGQNFRLSHTHTHTHTHTRASPAKGRGMAPKQWHCPNNSFHIIKIPGYCKRNRHFQCCIETKLLMI